jgi:hypothetical protein
MAKTVKPKPFNASEEAALRRYHLRPEDWEPVWRADNCNSFIIKRKGGYEMRTIEKNRIPS